MVVNYMPCCISVLMRKPLAPSPQPSRRQLPMPSWPGPCPKASEPMPPGAKSQAWGSWLPRPVAKDPDTRPRRRGPRPMTAAPQDQNQGSWILGFSESGGVGLGMDIYLGAWGCNEIGIHSYSQLMACNEIGKELEQFYIL